MSDEPVTPSAFGTRVMRAMRLDPELYEEVEADTGSMGQATAVVVLSSLAAGLGNLHSGGTYMIIVGTLAALVSWYVWALLTYLIGTRLLPEAQTRADQGELLRTTGFAAAPGLLRIFGLVPGLTTLSFLVAGVWMLIAMVIGVRQALDYTSTWRAWAVCGVGWLVQAVILAVILQAFALPDSP
ncbi:MAG: YIP1 family protein [Myxococcota bacterium]|nr:YIP1 family protein [Myxococcota bacterium]